MRAFPLMPLLLLSLSPAFSQQPAGLVTTPLDFSSSVKVTGAFANLSPDGAAIPANGSGHATASAASVHSTPFSGLALGVKVGLLGIGVEAATPLAGHLNLRGGANFFSYTDNLTSDGIHYDGNLRFRSAEASLDWFPFAGRFHISPGALLYNGNQITGNAAVPGGDSFTLNNVTYISSTTDPVMGTGSVKFNKAAPKLTAGFGNMLPRSGRHFSMPLEVGFAYEGDPKAALNLAGTVCYPDTPGACETIASDPAVQANIAAQQQKIANDASPARFYPILSLGFAVSF